MNTKQRGHLMVFFLNVIFISSVGIEAQAVELDCTCKIKCTNDGRPQMSYTYPTQHFLNCDRLDNSVLAPLNKPEELCGFLGAGWEPDEALCWLTLAGNVQLYGPAVMLYLNSKSMPKPPVPMAEPIPAPMKP